MLITVLVTLGIAMVAASILARSWERDRLVSFLASWLAVLAITQTWLAYLWKCDAAEWATAYGRDIQQSETPFQRQTQSHRQIQLLSPKICFADQLRAELIPFVQKRRVPLGLDADDEDQSAAERNTRSRRTTTPVASSEALLGRYFANSHRSQWIPWADITANPFSKNHTQSEATPAAAAMEAMRVADLAPLESALELELIFHLTRPQSHFVGKVRHHLRAGMPMFPITRPDVGKLAKSTQDALTGIVWHDDAQVVKESHEKVYSDQSGAWIVVRESE